MEQNNHYLSNVKLSGYKSIVNVDVPLRDGLNIIIGKNAAGKTNFLDFLNKVLDFSFDGLISFKSELKFSGSSQVLINSKREITQDTSKNLNNIKKSEVEITVYLNNEMFAYEDSSEKLIDRLLKKNIVSITPTIIKHGVPRNYYFIDSPFSFKIDEDGYTSDVASFIFDSDTPFFIKNLLASFFFSGLRLKGENIDLKIVREIVVDNLSSLDKIRNLLTKYSPIEDVRFNENFNIFIEKETNEFTVNNLFIEFKIQGSWHPFENLSDGTKRLFYIITEVGFPGKLRSSQNSFGMNKEETKRTILLEEPELGIHPHQLMALMNFLKAESQNKQIIVTSHSPIALDVLDANELDRIIIAYSENKKEGTKLRHLDDAEKAKALEYLENDYLSDYWKYSDLEK